MTHTGAAHPTRGRFPTLHSNPRHNITLHLTAQRVTTQHNNRFPSQRFTAQHLTPRHDASQHNTTTFFPHNATPHNTSPHATTRHYTTQHPTSKNMNTEINPNPTIGRASVEAQELAKHLETAEVGDVFTYQQLNTLAKCDVQKRNTVLQTARRIAQRQRKIVFDTIVGVGIKRLSDEEIPDVGDASIKRSRNIAKKGMRTLACADLGKMTQETKVKAITAKTILGLFSESGSRKVRCLVEQGARTESDNLKIGNISALFGR